MVGRAGIEPATNGLKVRCSTAELTAHQVKTQDLPLRQATYQYNQGQKDGSLKTCAQPCQAEYKTGTASIIERIFQNDGTLATCPY